MEMDPLAPLTPARTRALTIIGLAARPLSAREFAEKAWPTGFLGRSKCGRKATGRVNGAGATLKAGAFLRGLVRDGLLSTYGPDEPIHYGITPEGRAALSR